MSAVATAENETTDAGQNDVPRQWTRTDDRLETVFDYLAMIDRMYADADPRLVAALKDTTIVDTDGVVAFFGYKRRTRVFQLYTDRRELAEADQVPHPSAMPDLDAVAGHRGAREIRGVMKGRLVHWALQSGRYWWDFAAGELVLQEGINHGGAPRQN